MQEKENKPRCEECGSTQTYLRLKSDQRYCRICGHIQEIEIKEGNKK